MHSQHLFIQNCIQTTVASTLVLCLSSAAFVGHMPLTFRESLRHYQARSQVKFLLFFSIFLRRKPFRNQWNFSRLLHLEGRLVSSTPLLLEMSWPTDIGTSWLMWHKWHEWNYKKMLAKSNEVLKEAKAVTYRSFRPCLWAIMVSQNICSIRRLVMITRRSHSSPLFQLSTLTAGTKMAGLRCYVWFGNLRCSGRAWWFGISSSFTKFVYVLVS